MTGSKPCQGVDDSYVEFCGQIGIRLTRAQTVLFRVVCDGAEPKDFSGTDRDFAYKLFGEVEVLPEIARAVIVGLIGARSGKSYLFSIRGLHLALIHPLKTLAAGEQGFGLLVAPDLRLARQALRYVAGAIDTQPHLKRMAVSVTVDKIDLRRDDDRVVTIECLPATRGGSAVRGRSLFFAMLDEAAFFRDDNYVVNDEELYKAIAPRVLPGGQFSIASTPWAESGLVYDLWKANYGSPTTAVAVHASTSMLRDDEHTASFVERERQRDPQNASREFDANPMSSGSLTFFDHAALKLCIDESLPLVMQQGGFRRSWCGLDTAFRKNPAAAVIVSLEGGFLYIAEIVEVVPPKGVPLKPSEVLKELLDRARHHNCEAVIADGHYIETVREHVAGLTLIEAPNDKAEPYIEARTEIRESRLRIPAGQTKFIRQMKEVIGKPTSGGNLQITSPTVGVSHGDQASAGVLAIWAAVKSIGVAPTVLRGGTGVTGSLDRNGRRAGLFASTPFMGESGRIRRM
jgi:hypothetical protein